MIERPIGEETQKSEYKYTPSGDLEEEVDPLKHATTDVNKPAGTLVMHRCPQCNTVLDDPDGHFVPRARRLTQWEDGSSARRD